MTQNCILTLKEANAAFLRRLIAFFRGLRLAHTFAGADAALPLPLPLSGKYLMPRCTRTERQCLALFCSRCTGILTANKRVTVSSFVTSSLATMLQPSRAVPLIGFSGNKSENEAGTDAADVGT